MSFSCIFSKLVVVLLDLFLLLPPFVSVASLFLLNQSANFAPIMTALFRRFFNLLATVTTGIISSEQTVMVEYLLRFDANKQILLTTSDVQKHFHTSWMNHKGKTDKRKVKPGSSLGHKAAVMVMLKGGGGFVVEIIHKGQNLGRKVKT